MKKSIFLLTALSVCTTWFASCHTHTYDNQTLSVAIISPLDTSTVADASQVVLSVLFTASDELHDAEVELKNEANDSTVFSWEGSHLHLPNYSFLDTIDLSGLPAGTELHMTAKAYYDHDATTWASMEIHFDLP
jgi:hypothetical protein